MLQKPYLEVRPFLVPLGSSRFERRGQDERSTRGGSERKGLDRPGRTKRDRERPGKTSEDLGKAHSNPHPSPPHTLIVQRNARPACCQWEPMKLCLKWNDAWGSLQGGGKSRGNLYEGATSVGVTSMKVRTAALQDRVICADMFKIDFSKLGPAPKFWP